MYKRWMLLLTIICAGSSVHAENLIKIGSRVGQAVERAVTKSTLKRTNNLLSRTVFWQGTSSLRAGTFSQPITITETPHGPALALGPALEIPAVQRPFDFSYRARTHELQRLQDFIEQTGGHWIRYGQEPYDPVTFYSFISLVQKDAAGQLSSADQVQLYQLFTQNFRNSLQVNELEVVLKEWRKENWLDESVSPKLPSRRQLRRPFALDVYASQWEVAANIYLAQRIYGNTLPESLQKVNVIPDPDPKVENIVD